MANNVASNPLIFDTDFTSYVTASSNPAAQVKVKKLMLVVNATSVAGNVTIQDAASSANIYPPTAVAAALAVNAVVFNDNLATNPINWRDFKVTGLTATKTTLYVWLDPA